MNVDIAERLAKRRREAGLSQEALADKLGVTRQAVSKWERSESSPDTDNLIALADLYQVSLDDLLYVDATIRDDVAFESRDKAFCGEAPGAPDSQANDASFSTNPDDGANAADDSGKTGIHWEDGDSQVHVSWKDGIFVEDGKETVRINWNDGIRVEERNGEQAHVSFRDGVYVQSNMPEVQEWYSSGWHGKHSAWLKFPFPVLVVLVYLLLGFLLDAWAVGAFVFISIPVYYTIVNSIVKHKISDIFLGVYPLLAVAWFLYMWLIVGEPHPAWVVFLTIPIWEWAAHSIRTWYRRKKI
jgi:HTH-type transcriptional regulator/antitoxin HipB